MSSEYEKTCIFLVLTIIFSLNVFGQKKEVEIISVSENKVVAVRKLIFSIEAADKIKKKHLLRLS
jgi:hypothetical protein